MGLQHKINAMPLRLSGGERQRVCIARALVNGPLILLADEPTGNLDPELTIEIMNIFKEINAKGTTVLVATHDKSLISNFGRRSVVLEKGRLIKGGESTDKVLNV
jgi:cell division transport system ATP-binding protein